MATKERVMEAAITAAGTYGLCEVRTRHIALLCGVAEGTIYRHFTSKDTLLAACFQEIDSELASFLAEQSRSVGRFSDREMALQLLWERLCGFFLDNRDRTRFYFQFRDSSFFSPEMQTRSKSAMTALAASLERRWPHAAGQNSQVICFYMLSHAQWFSRQILAGELKRDRETFCHAFSMLYHGIGAYHPTSGAIFLERRDVG